MNSAMAYQITGVSIVYSIFFQAQVNENFKAPRYWHLCGEITCDMSISRTKGSNGENVFIWWYHHGMSFLVTDKAEYLCTPEYRSVRHDGQQGSIILLPADFPCGSL